MNKNMKLEPDSVEELVPAELKPLVFRFFVVFSRFEYALKRTGYVTTRAEPAWDKFASNCQTQFFPDKTPTLREACNYFETDPPRKQIIDASGLLGWEKKRKREKEPQLTWLLTKVRCVRNNLFHGGKYPFTPVPEPSRNKILIEHSLVILYACRDLDAQVLRFYTDTKI